MSNDERNFLKFWEKLDGIHKYYSLSRAAGNPEIDSRTITVVPEMVSSEDCPKLVNLWFTGKSLLESLMIPAQSVLDFQQLGISIGSDSAYEGVRDLIDCVRGDMRHADDSECSGLKLSRSLKAAGTPLAGDPRELSTELGERFTEWALFLNDEYKGGRLYFPTRKLVIEPKEGLCVRWPRSIPHGWEGIKGADAQFLLTGRSGPAGSYYEAWKEDEEPSSGIILPFN